MQQRSESVEAAEILNLCPHDIVLDVEGVQVTIAPSGLARCAEARTEIGHGRTGDVVVPLFRCSYGEVTGLPEPRPGCLFVVSHLVAERCPERDDLVVPDHLVRNDAGAIVAARALARI